MRPLRSIVGFAQLQQNEELALTLRTVLGGGVDSRQTRSHEACL
jgi:hypothetical protein